MVGLILRLIVRLVTLTVVWLLLLVRSILPVLGRAARFVWMVLVVSVVSLRVGLFNATARIARDWLGRAVHLGFPIQWEDVLYKVLLMPAFLTILTGWVILSVTFWTAVNLITDMLQ